MVAMATNHIQFHETMFGFFCRKFTNHILCCISTTTTFNETFHRPGIMATIKKMRKCSFKKKLRKGQLYWIRSH